MNYGFLSGCGASKTERTTLSKNTISRAYARSCSQCGDRLGKKESGQTVRGNHICNKCLEIARGKINNLN